MRTTLSRFLRPGALALLLGVVPLAPAWSQMVLQMPSATQPATPQQRALSLAVGEALRLENLSLDERSRSTVTAELRRITVTDVQTRFIVHTGDQTQDVAPPVRAHFTGQLVGEPNSSVFVSIDGDGAMRSIIDRGGDVFINEVVPGAAKRPALALSRRIDQESDFSERTFSCGVTPRFLEESRTPAAMALRQIRKSAAAQQLSPAPHIAAAPSVQHRADLIIETDYELFQKLGSSTSQVSAYVTDLFGYINTRYQSEAGARLNILQVNIYSTAVDPWTRTNSMDQLDDLMAYWNAAPRSAQARHHVHLLSAKDGNGGVAYVDTLDAPSYGYGVSTGIEGSFSATNPQIVWDALEVAHEIGHAFGSYHTHEFDKQPDLGSTEHSAIDCCVSPSGVDSQCTVNNGGAGRTGPLPGLGSIAGGVAGQRTGTIMSYCQTLSPGMTNVSFNFGTGHQYGVRPWRVADVLRTSAQSHLPVDNVAPPVSYTLAVTPSGTGRGNVSSSPSGIQCGSDCSKSYTAGTTVTLTAAAVTGSTFGGWTGSCSGTANTCNVAMDSPRSVGAVFTLASTPRLVTVSKGGSGSGSISSSPAGLSCAAAGCSTASASFPSSTAIALTATPSPGSTFGGWGDACTGSSNVCNIAAGTSSSSVTASFSNTTTSSTYTQQVITLFAGYFGRPAAPSGHSYYENLMRQSEGNYFILVDDFYKSAEAQAIYGSLGVQAQVTQIFNQLFSRMPLEIGLSYWTQQIAQHIISLPEAAYTVAYNASAADNAVLDAKRRAAQAFTDALGGSSQYATAYSRGQALGRAYLGCVTNASSADAAIAKLPVTMQNMSAGIYTYSCP